MTIELIENNNILKFTSLKKVHYEYGCKCSRRSRTFTIDVGTRTVICDKCKCIVDPFEVLTDLVDQFSLYREEYREFIDWYSKNRHLRAIKKIEELSSYGRNIPICPICKNPFELYELTNFVPLFSVMEKMKLRRGEQ